MFHCASIDAVRAALALSRYPGRGAEPDTNLNQLSGGHIAFQLMKLLFQYGAGAAYCNAVLTTVMLALLAEKPLIGREQQYPREHRHYTPAEKLLAAGL